jgi:hypothetical protein
MYITDQPARRELLEAVGNLIVTAAFQFEPGLARVLAILGGFPRGSCLVPNPVAGLLVAGEPQMPMGKRPAVGFLRPLRPERW